MGIEALDNNNPPDCGRLLDALRTAGFDACEYHSGGGNIHVAVDLVSDGSDRHLIVATSSVETSLYISRIVYINE